MLLATVVAGLTIVGCAKSEAQREAEARQQATPVRLEANGSIRLSEADRRTLGLQVATAQQGGLPQAAADRVGVVQTPVGSEVDIPAPASGRIVRGPTVTAGTTVTSGTLLMTIAPTFDAAEAASLAVQAADLDGQIRQIERELVAKDAEAARLRQLRQERIVSAAKEQAAVADAQSTRAKLDALRRQRAAQTKATTATLDVRAPASGTVAEIVGATGAAVHHGDTIVRILRTGERLVDVGVATDEPVGSGYVVLIDGSWAPARFVSRGASVGPDGLRHDRVALNNPLLLPGSTVSVRVLRAAAGTVIPESAVVSTAHGDLVFVQQSLDSFAPRNVRVADRARGLVRVDQGLEPGEVVVVRGAMELYGERMRPSLQ